jgi:Flp pilus assembly protein TadG
MTSLVRRLRARTTPDHDPRTRHRRGQSLTEFALVFPIFVTLVMGLIEFAFVFNAMLSVNYSARDAALAAAEAGDTLGADCVILSSIESAIGSPTSDDRIQLVEIYKTTPNGTMSGSATAYTRTGSTACTFIDGTTSAVPYTRVQNGYPEGSRCNILAGCDPLVVNGTVDNVGVRVTYTHQWVTPLRNFIGGGPGGITFDRASIMRMEPVL